MSLESRIANAVIAAIEHLVASGKSEFRPGDICDVMRSRNEPMGGWMVRAELSKLEAAGMISCDPATGAWQQRGNSPAYIDRFAFDQIEKWLPLVHQV